MTILLFRVCITLALHTSFTYCFLFVLIPLHILPPSYVKVWKRNMENTYRRFGRETQRDHGMAWHDLLAWNGFFFILMNALSKCVLVYCI